MSELLKSGQHPDADQLNAFVEHALPAHEQQATLAHLAVCTACRQIVALSLPPGDASPARQPEAVGRRWFPRWHPAWAGIPAFAALILVIFLIRNGGMTARQRSVPVQTADARLPVAIPAASPPLEAAREAEPLAQRSNPKRAMAAPKAPAPRIPATQQLAPGVSGGVMGGILGGIATQPEVRPQAQSNSFLGPSASVGGPMRMLAVDRAQSVLPTPSPLPSHLAILSMASQAEQRIAIDTGNQLFFSDDAGRRWKTVPSPWKGHAVRVALTASVPLGSAAPALKTSAAPVATTGLTLSGTITDPAGAVIPGAIVVATNSSGAAVSTVTTDGRGQFRMEGLAPGGYRIQAQATGFVAQSVAAEVTALQTAVADITLRVGSAAQTVTVEASPAPPLDKPSAGADLIAKPPTLSRFVLTTDDGEHWTSTDGQSWSRE
jgi:Carboxypeptidase regulatory-like domain